jgi:small subunit ribosomal protein S17
MADTTERNTRKERQGVVVSDVQDKTIVVRVERRTTHPLYGKTVTRSKKYHVHDEANEAGVGDTVRIAETRPISKLKRWRLAGIIERAK